ncbi:efflux RND transporter permease subunit, partial [Acinetobacter baumannii]
VDPLEKKIFSLENIKKIKTKISDGVAVLQVFYKYGSNVDDKYAELVREINSIRSELPKDIVKLEVQKVSPSTVNVLQLALVSN